MSVSCACLPSHSSLRFVMLTGCVESRKTNTQQQHLIVLHISTVNHKISHHHMQPSAFPPHATPCQYLRALPPPPLPPAALQALLRKQQKAAAASKRGAMSCQPRHLVVGHVDMVMDLHNRPTLFGRGVQVCGHVSSEQGKDISCRHSTVHGCLLLQRQFLIHLLIHGVLQALVLNHVMSALLTATARC